MLSTVEVAWFACFELGQLAIRENEQTRQFGTAAPPGCPRLAQCHTIHDQIEFAGWSLHDRPPAVPRGPMNAAGPSL